MNSRERQALDHYITDGRYSEWTEDFTCKKCGYRWSARMYTEYGMSGFINDDEACCPECGTDYDSPLPAEGAD